jgi:hypothetical protein
MCLLGTASHELSMEQDKGKRKMKETTKEEDGEEK